MKENKSKEENGHVFKSYFKKRLNVDVKGSMIKDRLSPSIFIFFGDEFLVELYTLSSHFCNSFFVRKQFYQTLLKLSGAFNFQLLY